VGAPASPSLPPQPDLTRGRCATALPERRGWWTSDSRWEREASRQVCLACPVVAACREWALHLPVPDQATCGAALPGGREQHYAKGTPVGLNTSGALYEAIRDRPRPENAHDQQGQAAVVLRETPDVAPPPGGHARGLRN